MNRPSEVEMRLSATLNALIGELNCEVMLLPSRREANDDMQSSSGNDGDVECRSAIIAVLHCVLDLASLEQLDMYSRAWIADAMESCERALEKLGCARSDASPDVTSLR